VDCGLVNETFSYSLIVSGLGLGGIWNKTEFLQNGD
jgi:hypothetical protein